MKKLLLAVATVMAISSPASADLVDNSSVRFTVKQSTQSQNTSPMQDQQSLTEAQQNRMNLCEQLTPMAGAIMKQRQLGASRDALTAEVESNPYTIARRQGAVMIQAAFNQPVQDTIDEKNQSIQEFERSYLNYCLSL